MSKHLSKSKFIHKILIKLDNKNLSSLPDNIDYDKFILMGHNNKTDYKQNIRDVDYELFFQSLNNKNK